MAVSVIWWHCNDCGADYTMPRDNPVYDNLTRPRCPVCGGSYQMPGTEAMTWPQVKSATLKRDGSRCRQCGATWRRGIPLVVHHIVPVVDGGRSEEANVVTLCSSCHKGIDHNPFRGKYGQAVKRRMEAIMKAER